jgi:8-oxo-dGTP pyrophosphatase MutT (NUDIX family)
VNTILIIRQSDVQRGYIKASHVEYGKRRAVRAVLFDKNGRVALLHGRVQDYYKLPGGGIDEGEEVLGALARELLEEVGATARVDRELGRIEEWRDSEKLHQISDSYVATVSGAIAAPDFTESERAEGFEVIWADDIVAAIALVESRCAHEDVLVRFMATRDTAILEAARGLIA